MLSTKVGYGIPGYQDWTGPCVAAGIDQALRLFRTDHIDIVHLHSCPLDTLLHSDVAEELQRAVDAGKVRVAAYSGDNEPVEWAVKSGKFGSIQTSLNICDQHAIDHAVKIAQSRGLGVIGKRSLANAFWRYPDRPNHERVIGEYWDRWKQMSVAIPADQLEEVAIRFAAFAPGAQTCLVGTASPQHLLENIRLVEKGPLPENIVDQIRGAFAKTAQGWTSLI